MRGTSISQARAADTIIIRRRGLERVLKTDREEGGREWRSEGGTNEWTNTRRKVAHHLFHHGASERTAHPAHDHKVTVHCSARPAGHE